MLYSNHGSDTAVMSWNFMLSAYVVSKGAFSKIIWYEKIFIISLAPCSAAKSPISKYLFYEKTGLCSTQH